jgi:phosphate transport system substrate-binding protein
MHPEVRRFVTSSRMLHYANSVRWFCLCWSVPILRTIAVCVLLLLCVVVQCIAGEKLIVKGSDTMVILAQRWAEHYMAVHPETAVQVLGGGSGSGIVSLIHGDIDICTSSRQMNLAEQERLMAKSGDTTIEVRCALDGLSFYVNNNNPVTELSVAQVHQIYTGRITNWKTVGGRNCVISLYGREENSGTYAYVRERVLRGEEFAATVMAMPGTAAIVLAVERDSAAIGYGGRAYGRGLRELKLRTDDAWPAYEPSPENIRDGSYPVFRGLYLYYRSSASATVRAFVSWILGAEGQQIVVDVGYVPIQ